MAVHAAKHRAFAGFTATRRAPPLRSAIVESVQLDTVWQQICHLHTIPAMFRRFSTDPTRLLLHLLREQLHVIYRRRFWQRTRTSLDIRKPRKCAPHVTSHLCNAFLSRRSRATMVKVDAHIFIHRPPVPPRAQSPPTLASAICRRCRVFPLGSFADLYWSRDHHPPMAPQYDIAVITVGMRMHFPLVINKAILLITYHLPVSKLGICMYVLPAYALLATGTAPLDDDPLQPQLASPSLRMRSPFILLTTAGTAPSPSDGSSKATRPISLHCLLCEH